MLSIPLQNGVAALLYQAFGCLPGFVGLLGVLRIFIALGGKLTLLAYSLLVMIVFLPDAGKVMV